MALHFYRGANKVPLPALRSEWAMKAQAISTGREMDGRFIVCFRMIGSWLTGRKRTAIKKLTAGSTLND